jgi:hypothetical protein
MKICYDELEKHQIKLSKNGNFRFWSGSQWKTIYYHESCENCGHPYLSGKTQRFCCKSCSNSFTMKNSPERCREFIKNSKKSKLEKYGDECYNNSKKVSKTKRNKSKEEKELTQKRKEETWIKNYGVSNPNKCKKVRTKIENTNLEKYGHKCSWGNKEVKEKCLKTVKEKYNCDDIINVFQIEEIKNKSKQTLFKKYGVDNVLKDPKFRKDGYEKTKKLLETINNKSEEEKELISKKLSDSWNNKSEEEKEEIILKRYNTKKENGSWGVSKASQIFFWKLYNLLSDDNKKECYFYELNRECRLLSYFVDFKVGNKIIEFNGDKWHANPKKYNKNDCPRPLGKRIPSSEIWNNDIKRNSLLMENGYNIYEVWLSDVKKCEEKELQKCLDFIN